MQLRHTEDLLGHYAYYEIIQTQYKDLNIPDNECKEDHGTGPSVRECIEQSVDRHLGCHIPWHLGDRTGKECNSEEQFVSYSSLASGLAQKDEEEILNATGCMRHCQRMEYRLSEVSRIGKKLDYPPDLLKIRFVYLTGEESLVRNINYHITHNISLIFFRKIFH